jgi:hypothetical protein
LLTALDYSTVNRLQGTQRLENRKFRGDLTDQESTCVST